jgi:hypothetical protein
MQSNTRRNNKSTPIIKGYIGFSFKLALASAASAKLI